ncbi:MULTISPECIES: HNH endonuclease [Elizabethkingia]|uniref:HNH endonuclease n=1 Tax=Elizabethkingia anophelis TaxID=1117645 RepID=A0A7Z7LU91_9FLAO|nr:HNH endonuclease [Elizabethkingia anophelis]STC97856.1 Uncharacterised protein [Elizabethkingia anophelis]
MNNKKLYLEKLKDPRWQKKRLEVLNRDEFTCMSCYSSDKTLHVHHFNYKGIDPWDTPTEELITLCEDCHKIETHASKEAENRLLIAIRSKGFFARHIVKLAKGFENLDMFDEPAGVAHVLMLCLSDNTKMEVLNKMYRKELSERMKS